MGGATALSARSRPASAQALDDLLGANRRVDGGWHKRNSYRKFRFAPRMPPPLLPDQRGLLRPMPLLPRARRTLRQSGRRSEEHTSELQSLMRISYAVFCLKKKT